MQTAVRTQLARSANRIERYTALANEGLCPPISDIRIDTEISALDKIAMENWEAAPEVLPLVVKWLRLKVIRKRMLH